MDGRTERRRGYLKDGRRRGGEKVRTKEKEVIEATELVDFKRVWAWWTG